MMRISYLRENINETPLTTALLSSTAIAFLFAYYDFNKNLGAILIVAMILTLIIAIATVFDKRDTKRFVEHRKLLCNEGCPCKGKIIGMNHIPSRFGPTVHGLIIEYHSDILDRTIQFTTPAVELDFKGNSDMTCIVYESADTKFKDVHAETWLNQNINEELDYSVFFIADTLNNVQENKNNKRDILAYILVIAGAAICIALLYDIFMSNRPPEITSVNLDDYLSAIMFKTPHL